MNSLSTLIAQSKEREKYVPKGPWVHSHSADKRRNTVRSTDPGRTILHTEPDDDAGYTNERFATAQFVTEARTYEPLFRDIAEKQAQALQSLLNKVNRVTCTWRHRKEVSPDDLTELSNRQIEVEQTLAELDRMASTGEK